MEKTHNRILITGQFWDSEFADLINGLSVPSTLIPSGKIETLQSLDQNYDLILVAQANRGSISQSTIDHLRALTGEKIPVVNLLGSWCEGQERSGHVLSRVRTIYWHQWTGSFEQLLELTREVSLPAGQRYEPRFPELELLTSPGMQVGISALCDTQAEFVADALFALELSGRWLEKAIWQAGTEKQVDVICVDADSLTENLQNRLQMLRDEFPQTPLIVLLNFPRKNEVEALQSLFGVSAVISKPFELAQLAYAITDVTGVELVSERAIPDRFRKRHEPSISRPSDVPKAR